MAEIANPIFIVGVNKSGTSLLYLAMSRHPLLSAIRAFRPPRPPGEADGPGRAMLYMENYGIGEGQRIPELPHKLTPKTGANHFAAGEAARAHRLTESDVEPGDAMATARAYVSAMVTPSARLCEKSPPNFIRTRYLQALFPDATFIALTRDPFANVAANGKKRTKWGGVAVQSEHWAEAHRLFGEDRPRLDRVLVVRYEELVADLDNVLRRVCAFCGLEFHAPMAAGTEMDPGVNARMVALLTDDEKALIAARCRGVADAVGVA